MRNAVAVVVVTTALLAAFWIVLVERIGPVILVLDSQHGLHSGDLLALPILLAALAFSTQLVRPAR